MIKDAEMRSKAKLIDGFIQKNVDDDKENFMKMCIRDRYNSVYISPKQNYLVLHTFPKMVVGSCCNFYKHRILSLIHIFLYTW